ncbi:hypothetical protein ATO13_22536 [Stappia sp. 22II-S9-Z10]|nr:hypothetical protein ATO13_22536 [Stappia sp. 22II-S9-Z10]
MLPSDVGRTMGKGSHRMVKGPGSRLIVALCCLLVSLWALQPASAHLTVHAPGSPSERQVIMTVEHGHAHSPVLDLLWALHGHSHDAADHDHNPAITPLPPAAPSVREPVVVMAARATEGGPAVVYRIERPPRG